VTELRTTEKGRIWSYDDPSLGATANAAFIATAYATYLKPLGDPKARTYTCWAQQQVPPPPLSPRLPHHTTFHTPSRRHSLPLRAPRSEAVLFYRLRPIPSDDARS